jgi:two-component system response regulator RpaA
MRLGKPRQLYSTGDVAKICGVTINTVVKWFEAGELKGKRTSATGARRITRKSLFSFLKKGGFPADVAAAEAFRVLVVDSDRKVVSFFRNTFRRGDGYAIDAASSSFEAGLLAGRLRPHVVFISVDPARTHPRNLAALFRGSAGKDGPAIVAMGRRLGKKRAEELAAQFDAVMAKPLTAQRIREVMAAHSS